MTYFVSGLTDGTEDDYSEDIPDLEGWYFDFPDGSTIELVEFDAPRVIIHGRRITEYMAETEMVYILENELDNEEAKTWILNTYKKWQQHTTPRNRMTGTS